MFHNEADRILDFQVFWSTSLLDLRRYWMLLMLDVFQRVLHQITHCPVLGGIQCLNVLQDV